MRALIAGFALLTVAVAARTDLTAVSGDLQKLKIAQETYYSDHGSYTSNIGALKFTPSEGVGLKFEEFNPNAYAVTGTLKGANGVSCVMYIGRVAAVPKTAKGKVATGEGAITCDE